MKELKYSYYIISAAILLIIITPFVISSEVLLNAIPLCEAKAEGSSCFACGLTTGFINISNGDFSSASASNSFAIPLFIIFLLNTIFALGHFLKNKKSL